MAYGTEKAKGEKIHFQATTAISFLLFFTVMLWNLYGLSSTALCKRSKGFYISSIFTENVDTIAISATIADIQSKQIFFKESCKIKDLPQLVSYFELGEEAESLTTLLL